MKRVLWLALLAMAATSCIRSEPIVRPEPPASFVRITPSYGAAVHSRYQDPARLVIRDVHAFAIVWNAAFAGQSPAPPIPGVDFKREMVIVTAMGEQPSGGFGIEITGAELTGNRLQIDVRSTMPGNGCVTSMELTHPIDIARVPLAQMVEFHERTTARRCDGASVSPSRQQ